MSLTQPTLFDPVENQKSIYKRFLDFHIQNPRVYVLFEKFVNHLIKKGHTKIGAKMIMERIRWEYFLEGRDDKGFKVNNDYTAHYVRLFIKNNPDFENYFELRQLKAV